MIFLQKTVFQQCFHCVSVFLCLTDTVFCKTITVNNELKHKNLIETIDWFSVFLCFTFMHCMCVLSVSLKHSFLQKIHCGQTGAILRKIL